MPSTPHTKTWMVPAASRRFKYTKSAHKASTITGNYIINPLRMRSRVTVVCLSVCASVTALAAPALRYRAQAWYYGINTVIARF